MQIIQLNNTNKFRLGYQGEYGVTCGVFDCSEWVDEFGEGVVVAYHQRGNDKYPYPLTLVRVNNLNYWYINEIDTAQADSGQLEFQFYKDGVLKKNRIITTITLETLDTNSTITPEPYEHWLQEMTQMISDLETKIVTAGTYVALTEQYKNDAYGYMENASLSAQNASNSEESAIQSANNALLSESNAHTSEINAKNSEDNALLSSNNASTSELNAKQSEENTLALRNETEAFKNATQAIKDAVDNEVTGFQAQINLKADKDVTYTKTEVDALVEGATPKDYEQVKQNVQNNTQNISSLQISKQDEIKDLEAIRSGASKGETAVQDENYQHTDNNYTTEEKTKLGGIEEGANNYVLPNDVVKDSSYVHTDNNFTDEEKSKLQNASDKVDGLISDEEVTLENTWSSQKIANKINDIELAKFPNVTIIGQPTIQQGQISNFSSTNYCQFPFVVDFQNQAFELDFEITTGSEVTQQHNIFDSVFGLAFAVRQSKFVLAVSTNGTSWNIGEVLGSHVVLPNTTYRIKLVWDKQNLTLEYSTDGGTTYILDSTRALTEQPYPKQIFIGVTSDKSTIFNGIINLNYATLTIANKVVWQGMDDVGLATRMAVDMSNIDVAGVNKVKEIILNIKHRLVKEGLIDNDIVLTDEEKLKIETWLGLSENYLTYYNEMPYQVNGDYNPAHKKYVDEKLVKKQETLISGINIKTINNEPILGSGNINVGITDGIVPLLLDGTLETYRKVMKQWFLSNGVKVVTSVGLTELVSRWYTISRDNWSGGVKFYQPTSTQGATGQSTGIAFGDNIGLNCSPSTDTIKGTDNYEGLPLFAITDCNWAMNGDEPLITAIDGITDNFVRDSEDNLVGVLQMNGYHSYDEDDEFYTHTYSSNYEDGHSECAPLPESVAIDGSVRPYVVHAKYMAYWNGQKYTCCAGVIPSAWQSHDIAVSRGKSLGISGGCLVDYAFLKLMYHLKYKNLASDGVLQGCCNYNYQRYAIVSETNTNRILLSSGRVSEFEVGSSVLIGAYNGSTDRNNSGCYNISGQSGRKVLKVENVNINGTTYTQVVVDGNPFNTVASTSDTTATTGATIISSFHYVTGYCDSVLGNDGSPKSATSGKYPARLQGIEYAVGGYEVFADTIQNHNGTEYEVYTCNRLANQGTSLSTHIASGLKIPQPGSNNWYYPKKWGYAKGLFYPTIQGTSSSQFLKDGFYMLGSGQTGTKEFLSFGGLHVGSGSAGLSCLSGDRTLSLALWLFLVRLSPNSNRGEFVA